MEKRNLGIVVSHTHWDRAWYLPFQTYRLRLVRLIDDLLDILDSDLQFKSFMLDGQTVLLEDYLLMRPQNRERISEFVNQGRLLIGPWYTLPDLFLPTGESVVRNLQVGRQLSFAFGRPMPVGYVPDPFGHFAQMPQILRGFGLDSFLFMRGTSSATKELGSIFNWISPDGSDVLAVYLQQGYLACSALGHPSQFGRFDGHAVDFLDANKRVEEAISALLPLQKERTVLLMNGCDHMPPQRELPSLLKLMNAENDKLCATELRHGTLTEFLAELRNEQCEHGFFSGDLIGNADHPILLSVYSTRMYLKQMNHKSQSLLCRIAEPLAAFVSLQGIQKADSGAFLEEAWKILLRNHAHDNICGCSADSVHKDDEVRFSEVDQIASAIVTEALELLSKEGISAPTITGMLSSDVFVLNPHPFPVQRRVEAEVLFPNPNGEWAEATVESGLSAVFAAGNVVDVEVLSTEPRVVRSAFLETTWGRRYKIAFDISLPALGYEIVHIFENAKAPLCVLHQKKCELENNCYRVQVENGKLSVLEKTTGVVFADVLRFEYENDSGDTYSFSAVPEAKLWRAAMCEALVANLPSGHMQLRYEMFVPASYSRDKGCVGEVLLSIVVRVVLLKDGDLEFFVDYENQAHDGRLRVLFATGMQTSTLFADGHFRIVERINSPVVEPSKRPYPGETSYDTHHQGDFCFVEHSSGYRVWCANRGNPEVSLVNRGAESSIAVTLHRSVGYLSVYGGSVRQCQAGPQIPTPEAQCLRHFSHSFVWGAGAFSRSEIVRKSLVFSHPVFCCEMPYLPHVAKGHAPRARTLLTIDNGNILLSALKPVGEKGIAIRCYNTTSEPQEALLHVAFPVSRWVESSFDETWSAEGEHILENQILRMSILPHEIRTIVLS